MKTMKEWNGSGLDLSQYLQVGDTVDEEMFDYFVGVLPPATMTSRCVQIGEPTRHNGEGKPMFETLEKLGGLWTYAGVKVKPSNILPIDKWAKDNLAGNVQRDKGRFQHFEDDKTAASWGCNCPIIEGYRIAWITLSAQHTGDKQSTFYDYVKAS